MSHYILVHTEEGLYRKGSQPPYRSIDPPRKPSTVRLEVFRTGSQYVASFHKRRELPGNSIVWALDLTYLEVGIAGCTLEDALESARHTVHLRYGEEQPVSDAI